MSYTITVKGNIFVKEGIHYAQGWGAMGIASLDLGDNCFESIESKPIAYNVISHTIDSDLVIDKESRLTPYATYCAEGGLAVASGKLCPFVDVSCTPGYYPAIRYYHQNMGEIRQSLCDEVGARVEDAFLRGLYISVFSIFELFLCDYLLCGIFNVEGCYERALVTFNIENAIDPDMTEKRIMEIVNSKVFHRFDKISILFESILNRALPISNEEFKVELGKRNDLVHRFVFTKEDHMNIVSVTREEVEELINKFNKIVDRLGG